MNDDDRARFPGDTELPPGAEFVIVRDKHPWPASGDPLHYIVEMRSPGTTWREGSRYSVPASELEAAQESA